MTTTDAGQPPVLDEARIAAALADEGSRRILASCISKGRTLAEIAKELGPDATVSDRVARLVEHGLLAVGTVGSREGGEQAASYRARVQSAKIEVDRTGVRVVWRPREAVEARLARAWMALRGV